MTWTVFVKALGGPPGLQRDTIRINLGGDFGGNSQRLYQSNKAINPAIVQLLHTANDLGSVAKTTAATIPELDDEPTPPPMGRTFLWSTMGCVDMFFRVEPQPLQSVC
eukprot:TRINITY_DN11891_c0_g1_i1.p2 TRINITY_DN11891_c0_g1~~TRINITY_DN11891_c0_g1_i1.p2  ORF type:complete len:108 (+),score=25.62 TRINITY_DN11891_c0_g1_i1:642-965(+)